MLTVKRNHVYLEIEDTPLTSLLQTISQDDKPVQYAVTCADLTILFLALINRYGKSQVADMIQGALETAIKNENIVKVVTDNAKSGD